MSNLIRWMKITFVPEIHLCFVLQLQCTFYPCIKIENKIKKFALKAVSKMASIPVNFLFFFLSSHSLVSLSNNFKLEIFCSQLEAAEGLSTTRLYCQLLAQHANCSTLSLLSALCIMSSANRV